LDEPDELATVLWQLASAAWWCSKFDKARAVAEEGLAVSRAAGLRAQEGMCLYVLAAVADWVNEPVTARALAQQCLETHTSTGYVRGVAIARQTLGRAVYHLGDLATARALLEQAVDECRDSAYPYGIAWSLITLGWIASDERDYARARTCLLQALNIFREFGAVARVAETLEGFAQLASAEGQWRRALRLGGAAHAQRERTGLPLMPVAVAWLEPRLQRARSSLGLARAEAAWAEGLELTIEGAAAEAIAGAPVTNGAPRSALLTTRQWEVARLVAQGLSTRQIAEQLVITQRTAETHLERIYNTLDLHSRVQLAAWIAAS
jgi:non-specific serine/threonine protein kinase